jgi:hypothetical protein
MPRFKHCFAIRAHRSLINLSAFTHNNRCFDCHAILSVFNANYRCVTHSWNSAEQMLNRSRCDLLSTTLEDFIAARDERKQSRAV